MLIIEKQQVGQVIKFNENEFLNDINNLELIPDNRIEIECEVYAAILSYYFNMLGISCRFAYVLNPIEIGNGRYEELHMQDIYPAGDMTHPQSPNFKYHMIVEVSPQKELIGMDEELTGMDGVRVFDASMGVMVEGRIECLAGYPFYGQNKTLVNRAAEQGTYRGLAFQNGTGAIIYSSVFVFVKVN